MNLSCRYSYFVRLYYPYRLYINLFIFRFVSPLCLRRTLRLFDILLSWMYRFCNGGYSNVHAFYVWQDASLLTLACKQTLRARSEEEKDNLHGWWQVYDIYVFSLVELFLTSIINLKLYYSCDAESSQEFSVGVK